MAIDHTTCTHPRTQAGRRACRAGRNTTPTPIDGLSAVKNDTGMTVDYVVTPELVEDVVAGYYTGNGRRKRTPRPVRKAAPKATRHGSCPQAALHVGEGRCACGWQSIGCATCGNPLLSDTVTGPNAGGMCGPTYCHHRIAN